MDQPTMKTDQKMFVELKTEKNGNIYTFHMPYMCPVVEAHEAAGKMLEDLVAMYEVGIAQAKEKEAKEKVDKEVVSK